MLKVKFKIIFIFLLLFNFYTTLVKSEVVEKITIIGNERISDETIQIFSNVKISNYVDSDKLNQILIDLYDSNFFENLSLNLKNNNLEITVVEFPIIENISYEGVKSSSIIDEIKKNLKLKNRSSFNQIILEDDKERINSTLKELGYFFSKTEIFIENLKDNRVNVNFKIDLGKKAKIKKISFIGNKVFKDSKLRSVIVSEEYKFWKFISGKIYLNESIISLDQRLLKNFYLNQGYFNAQIKSSFAKLINADEFELIYNIESDKKFFFNDLKLIIPSDFEEENFSKLRKLLENFKGEIYSINSVQNILEQIEEVTLYDEYKSINALVEEDIVDNIINLNFIFE